MKRALVTGATSGLGLEFAWQLASAGYDLTLVAPGEERLAAVAAQIETVFSVEVEILAADLAIPFQLEKVARRLTDPVEPINFLVNHSGHSLRCSFLDSDVNEHLEQMDLMMRATLVLCHAAAGAMLKKRNGRILNVSTGASLSRPTISGAAKSWIQIFSEALAEELKDSPVSVTVLLPGVMKKEEHNSPGRKIGKALTADGIPRISWTMAPYLVRQAIKDCENAKLISRPSGLKDGVKAVVTEHSVTSEGRKLGFKTLLGAGISMAAIKLGRKRRKDRA